MIFNVMNTKKINISSKIIEKKRKKRPIRILL